MHLRGPMNVSQLAVYQLPSEIHTLQKRNTVPFYNRRRALNKRQTDFTAQVPFQDADPSLPLEKRTFNTTTSCSPRTVTTTVTVTDCEPDRPTSTIEPLQNTTYVGTLLPCMPTPSPSSPGANLSAPNCTCENPPTPSMSSEQQLVASTPLPVKRTSAADGKHTFNRRAAADWSRVAYYTSAAPAQATGFSFLANLGDPQKSGTFD